MSRYIDAEDVIEHAEVNGERKDFIRKLTDYLMDAPTIDIVQCGECIYPKEYDGFYKCNYSAVWRKATDSCSYGERSER